MNKEDIVNKFYPQREGGACKYDHGMVVVIGGSKFYTGSPALSALAALRAGADITQILAPERAADVGASFSPDLITFPLSGDHLTMEHLPDLLTFTRSAKDVSHGRVSVVLGGGLGRDQETKEVVREYIKETDVPLILDADAIYAFEEEKHLVRGCVSEKEVLFTPHLYEFYVLTGKDVRTLKEEERGEVVREMAKDLGAGILLKGATDIISDGEDIRENHMEVPHLTSGGTGDVLAGIAGTLVSREFSILDSGWGAASMNTIAGEMAANEKGDSLVATDLIDKIMEIIK